MMVHLVYGSPCSGKSTYIREHAKAGDLICDVDTIYAAISGHDEHGYDLYTHEIACELCGRLKDIIRDRSMEFKDAYVVSLANTPERLKKDMERVNADDSVFIDTPYDICAERAKERPHYFRWIIEEWFQDKTL